MATPPLDYASHHIARGKRFPWKRILLSVAIPAALLCAWTIEVSTADTQIDAVTGTMLRKTSWPFGLTSGVRVDVSPLETRLKLSGIPWAANWCYLNSRGQNLFGIQLYIGCSSAPPIHDLRPVLNEFVKAATDAELREFVRVMQTGTEQQQKAVVDAAVEKAFGYLETGKRGEK